MPLWKRLFVLQKKLLQFFSTKEYQIQKIFRRHSLYFILYLFYSSDIMGVMNHCNCYLQGPGSNIVDFAIKLTTSGVGKVRIASHMRLFDLRNVAFQLLGRNPVDLSLFCNCTYTPHFQLLGGRRLFLCSSGLTGCNSSIVLLFRYWLFQ